VLGTLGGPRRAEHVGAKIVATYFPACGLLYGQAPLSGNATASLPVGDFRLVGPELGCEGGNAPGETDGLRESFHGTHHHASCCQLSTPSVLDGQHAS
jgi:hypothetical protein